VSAGGKGAPQRPASKTETLTCQSSPRRILPITCAPWEDDDVQEKPDGNAGVMPLTGTTVAGGASG